MKDDLLSKKKIATILIIISVVILILSGIAIVNKRTGLILNDEIEIQMEPEDDVNKEISDLKNDIYNKESRTATLDDFCKIISEKKDLTLVDESYNGDGTLESIKVLYNNYIFTIGDTLDITLKEDNLEFANVDFNYEIKNVLLKDGKTFFEILISLNSDDKISEYEYDTNVVEIKDERTKFAVDFVAENGVGYKFKVATLNGKSVEKTFVINKNIMTGISLDKESMYLGLTKESKLELSIFPSDAVYKSIEWTSSNPSVATVDQNGKVVASSWTVGSTTITVTVDGYTGKYTKQCIVEVINDEELSNAYLIDINNNYGGNCIVINEIEFYNSKGELLNEHYYNGTRSNKSYNNFNVNVYDRCTTSGVPSYWNREIWDKTKLFNGATGYNASGTSATSFCYSGSGSVTNGWVRLLIHGLSEEVSQVKIYSPGNNRRAKELSVFSAIGYKNMVINKNLKVRNNDGLISWGTQNVNSGSSNTFTKP